VTDNSLVFQIGANPGQRVAVQLTNVSTKALGKNVANDSGFGDLSALDVRNAQGAEDTVRVVDKAIDDVNRVRAQLGAVQKNSLESNIRSLRSINYYNLLYNRLLFISWRLCFIC